MDEPRALRRARPHDFSAVRLLQRIAVLANEADTFDQALSAALVEVCAYAAWPVGHAYVLDPRDRDLLVSSRRWYVADGRRYETLIQVTEETKLTIGRGLPGRVLKSKRAVWVRDATTDDNFPRSSGHDLGIKGSFGVPVLVGKDVVAVLEFFSARPEPRDDLLLELVSYVGTQLGRVWERAHSAAALHHQAEQTRRLIESAFDAFVAVDGTGAVTTWNQAAEKLFGWRHDEVVGRNIADTILPKDYREQHTDAIAQFLTTGDMHLLNKRVELTAVRKDGSQFPVEVAVWGVNDAGRVTICSLIHDITERRAREREKEAADALIRSSEQRLVAAQEMAEVGSWEWDTDSGEMHWSDQQYRNCGVTPETFDPSFEGFLALVHPQDRSYVAATITKALDRLGTFDVEYRIVRPSDNAVRIHHSQGRTTVEAGRAINVVGTNQDITERRRGEDALQEAYFNEREMVKRLEQLDTARTDFVASVSHELRTPLTSIIGYLQLVLDMGHEISDEHLQMLDIVDRNSQRLLALIEDLLTKSRIESGTFKLNIAPTDLGSIIDASVTAMLPSASEHNLALSVDVDDTIGSIDADGPQVERLVLNLLSNAIKFTEDGTVSVRVTREGEGVQIQIADSGIGIAAEELPQLFSPFFRTEQAEKTAPGTGLGLVLVKAIVEAHGGTIEVDSVLEEGTTVTVRLPIAQPEMSAALASGAA